MTTKSNHTAGPIICLLRDEPDQKANAQLIAIATDLLRQRDDLLAAAKRALVAFKNMPPRLNEDRYEPLMMLTDAIAKAEKGQS